MPGIRCPGSLLVSLLGIGAALSGCEPFNDTSYSQPRGTLGEEIDKLVCERMSTEAFPNDVSGREARALCNGAASASAAPEGRLRALIENRDRTVVALDRTLRADMEHDLQDLLVSMIPLYDPPL